jgi:hypothetical protein
LVGCGGRGPTSSGPRPEGSVFDVGAAGRDRARSGPRRFHSGHRCAPRPVTVDGVAGAAPQRRRAGPLPGHVGACTGLPPRLPAEAGQAGSEPGTAWQGGSGPGQEVLPGADRGPVEGRLSRSAGDAGEHRNHLPIAVCAVPRRPETGPDQVFENRPGSPQALPQTRATQEPHPEHDQHLRTAGRGR